MEFLKVKIYMWFVKVIIGLLDDDIVGDYIVILIVVDFNNSDLLIVKKVLLNLVN